MEKKGFDDTKITRNLSKIKHKLIVLSGKGGVGKSTVSANLALFLSEKGYNVGLLDSDIHGPSIPKILGIEDRRPQALETGINPVSVSPRLSVMSMGFLLHDRDSPVIWRGPLKMGAIKQFIGDVNWGDLDYLIVDLPPGTGDEPLSIAQLIPGCDGAIIVTTPQDVALVSVRKSINFVKKMNIPVVGIIENMSGFKCPHCGREINIFKTGGGLKASEDFMVPFLGKIPIDPKIVETGDTGEPFIITNAESETAKAFIDVVNKIEEIVNKKEVK
ncbi:MAG: ATP-binding protein [Thermoplasmata archaeon]|nr:MAG: Mrp/NBP35 family ATP-binding protein [Thermoplasmata archaeon]RLF33193.1 MAG: ATP-binding protein [Thermoplasmata archaeon]RLF52583.1 MAG: ATP-binding protein [Thermoplasmata archaeon]